METASLNDYLTRFPEITKNDVRGFYLNILTWRAYDRGNVTAMLEYGDAVITTAAPSTDAIHYYLLIPRQVLGLVVSPHKVDVIRTYSKIDMYRLRAAIRDGTLARILNSRKADSIKSDARRGDDEDVNALFDYDVSKPVSSTLHDVADVFEGNATLVTEIMHRQIKNLKLAFVDSPYNIHYFINLDFLLLDVGQSEFDRMFYNPIDPSLVHTPLQGIVDTLVVSDKRATFYNIGAFRVKSFKIPVPVLYETMVANRSFSKKTMIYTVNGTPPEIRDVQHGAELRDVLVFIMQSFDSEEFKTLVGIMSNEHMLFVQSADFLRSDAAPRFFVIRPGTTPILDLALTSDDIDDSKNFLPITNILK